MNCYPINVALKVQRLVLIGLLYGDDFGETPLLNVLREAIFGNQIGAGEETVHGGWRRG